MLEANLTTTRSPELIDPEAMFGLPENLLINSSIADATKVQVLNLWKRDLMLLMTATDENMPACTGASLPYAPGESTAEMLRRVSNVLLALDPIFASGNDPSHRA